LIVDQFRAFPGSSGESQSDSVEGPVSRSVSPSGASSISGISSDSEVLREGASISLFGLVSLSTVEAIVKVDQNNKHLLKRKDSCSWEIGGKKDKEKKEITNLGLENMTL
jgi:hypothetical protein